VNCSERFAAAVASAGGRPGDVEGILADLEARHAEPHRRYHTLEHVTEVLAEVDRLSGSSDDAVVLAAWFHDAVYDVHAPSGGSEAASADLAASSSPPRASRPAHRCSSRCTA